MVSTCLRLSTWRTRGLSKWVISRVISTLNGVTLIITLLITDLLSPLGLQVVFPFMETQTWNGHETACEGD